MTGRRWAPAEVTGDPRDPRASRDDFDAALPRGEVKTPRKPEAVSHYRPAQRPVICTDCHNVSFYQATPGGRWLCSTCRPAPGTEPARVAQAPTFSNPAPAAAKPRKVYPTVKFYPLMLILADRAGFGGAVRLWFFARDLDRQGSGRLEWAALRAHVVKLGTTDRTARNWFKDALALGLFTPWRDRPGTMTLAGISLAAARLGVVHLDKHPVTMPARKLLMRSWRRPVWGAYIRANHQGKEVSQDTLSRLTGVPPATQRRWNHGTVKRRRNIALTTIPVDHLAGYREFGDGHRPFIWFDIPSATSRTAIHIPSTNSATSRTVAIAPRGRTRKTNRAIAGEGMRSLCIVAQAQNFDPSPPAPMFCKSRKKVDASLLQIRKREDDPRHMLFLKYRQSPRGRGVWEGIPC